MNAPDAKSQIEHRFHKLVDENPDFHSATFLIHSEERDVHWNLAAGHVNGTPTDPAQPFHAASIGKTFTASIIAILSDEGRLAFDDPITSHLSDVLLDDLHVYRGTDYTGDIRIRHLLRHTSGLPHLIGDEFGLLSRRKEQSPEGKTFFDVMLEDPDRFWEPEETIEWAKENLQAHFPPGDGIFYSEVGYNLLGLIIEDVTGQTYHDTLHEYFFDPLSMNHSYLSQFSAPAVQSELPIAPFWSGDEAFDVERFRSFSGWFAGGQIVHTTEDLLAFHRALAEGELVSEETLEEMTTWRRLTIGLGYGMGVLQFRPVPFLGKYYCWGGLGSTNSFMLYNPSHDVYLVGNFNQMDSRRKVYRFLFRVLRMVAKIDS